MGTPQWHQIQIWSNVCKGQKRKLGCRRLLTGSGMARGVIIKDPHHQKKKNWRNSPWGNWWDKNFFTINTLKEGGKTLSAVVYTTITFCRGNEIFCFSFDILSSQQLTCFKVLLFQTSLKTTTKFDGCFFSSSLIKDSFEEVGGVK